MKKNICIIIVMGLWASSWAIDEVSVGDTLKLVTWFEQFLTIKNARMTHTAIINSISQKTDSSSFYLTLIPDSISDEWKPLIPEKGIELEIVTLNLKPSSVIGCSNKFETCNWLVGLNSSFALIGNMRFLFPILDTDNKYLNGDWYNVKLNDTINVQCRYSAKDTAFLCEMIRSDGKIDTALLKSSPDLKIKISNKNPFRFGSVAANSAVSKYSNVDLSCCGKGYYGIDIIAYNAFDGSVLIMYKRFLRPVPIENAADVWFDLQGRQRGYKLPGSVMFAVSRKEKRVIQLSPAVKKWQ